MPFASSHLPQALTASALLLMAAGCASPGQPRPPSLHIPALATGLHAQRIGDQVHLTWSTPADSTDGQGLRGPITAAICRDSQPRAPLSPECHRVAAFPVTPGPSQADDSLPPSLLTGAPALLLYRVQLLNAAGRAAPPSSSAWSASGHAPPPMGPISVTPTRQGAVIAWTPASDPSPVELRRTLISAPPRPAASPAKTAAGQATLQPRPTTRKPPPALITLRAESLSPDVETRDPGGLLDPGVQRLGTYSYTAQRVQTITLSAPAFVSGGKVSVELRGLPSPAAVFVYRDVFPPRPPTGVAAIANPGDAALPTAGPPSIDLSWEPGLEPDLLGYNLYRADSPQGPFSRLNASPILGPSFRDLNVHSGQSYLYRVTALDRSGNESQPSQPLPQTLSRP